MNRILVAYDFSAHARRALALAMQGFPFGHDVSIELLHVIDEGLYESVLSRRQMPDNDAIESYLHAELARVRAELVNSREPGSPALLEPVPVIVRGRPHAVIDAHLHQPEVIGALIGGQGHGGATERLLGRTAQRVIRHADVPTLTIQHPRSLLPPTRLLAAVDWSENSGRALQTAARLGRQLDALLSVVHVVDSPYVPYMEAFGSEADVTTAREQIQAEQLERLAEFVKRALRDQGEPIALTERVVLGDPAEQISQQAAVLLAELVVVGARGQTDLSRFLLGSTAEKLVTTSPCDILVVP